MKLVPGLLISSTTADTRHYQQNSGLDLGFDSSPFAFERCLVSVEEEEGNFRHINS